MSSITQCQNDIVKCGKLKSNLDSIITMLSLAVKDTDDLNTEIKSKYLINDNPAKVSSTVMMLKNDMRETLDYLNNTIKPAINDSLDGFKREKSRLEQVEREQKEKEERERQERKIAEGNR